MKNVCRSQLEIQTGCHSNTIRKRFIAIRACLVICKMCITVYVTVVTPRRNVTHSLNQTAVPERWPSVSCASGL